MKFEIGDRVKNIWKDSTVYNEVGIIVKIVNNSFCPYKINYPSRNQYGCKESSLVLHANHNGANK